MNSDTVIEADYRRMGMPNGSVRFSRANAGFEICKSYPRLIVVPDDIGDDDVSEIASFRSKWRVPAIEWMARDPPAMLVRCSQPRTGLRNARCEADEKFLYSVRQLSHNSGVIQLLDARPLLNAMANRLKGAGTENLTSGYPNCSRRFLNIGNIHKMRQCLERLRIVLAESPAPNQEASPEQAASFDSLWTDHIRLIVAGAHMAAESLVNGISCVVHCSDGWDRTPQITALTQLLVDPYYRTFAGFQSLVEKEWCAFSHKFSSRMATESKKLNDSERAPIFLQWIDSVFQISSLFPKAFEFNTTYLKDILHHAHSGRYGTFFFDSYRQRVLNQVAQKTDSLWTGLNII
ncbi:MAG: myotubularin family protein, partial [Gammaproteobacteria bacterium]|nr:myotubularin family protein [Gammaproteobacteria bacterium]